MDTLQQELLQELPEFEKRTQLFYHKEMSVKDYKGYSGGFGSSFDYAFVYGRQPELDIAGIPLNSHDLKRFDNEDERGWYAYDQLRKTGSNDRREDRPNMYYAIQDPDGNELYPTAVAGYDSCWRVERKTYDQLVADNYILWKKTVRNNQEVWWPYV